MATLESKGSQVTSEDICCSLLHSEASTKYPAVCDSLVGVSNYKLLPLIYTSALYLHSTIKSRKCDAKICKSCIKIIRELEDASATANQLKKRKASSSPKKEWNRNGVNFDDLLRDIKAGKFSKEELQRLLETIGEKVGTDVAEFVANANEHASKRRLQEMIAVDSASLWQNTCSPIRSFVDGVISSVLMSRTRDVSTDSAERRARVLYRSMEGIYSAVNSNYISSFALAEMLFAYFLSNSRLGCVIQGAANGCASFQSLQRTLSIIGCETPVFPSDGYVIVAFDNNQVLGRTYRVQLESKFRANVVTTITAFKVDVPNNPQERTAHFPMYYGLEYEGKRQLLQKIKDFHSSAKDLVRVYLVNFLEQRLEHLSQPEYFDPSDADFQDYVSTVRSVPPERIGLNYTQVPQEGVACHTYDQPCIETNPNSYKGVKIALDEILRTALSTSRKWITVVADGLPYSIAQEIIRRYVGCTLCEQSMSELDIDEHYKRIHDQSSPLKHERKYCRILLRPGPGHYEMNLVRATFSEWFNIFIEPIAELMGFRSAKAKSYCAGGGDHHKTWQMLEITFEALTDEVLLSYLRLKHFNSPETSTLPSASDFIEAVSTSPNNHLKGAYQFLFEMCFPIILFRMGIRQCNFDVTVKAREYASAIFYAFRHSKYQKINCYDMAELIQIPNDFRPAVYQESFLIPGSSSGQGIDFLLEQRNRKLKAFVVHNGIPTNEQWQQASKSLPTLEKIVEAVGSRLQLPVSSGGHQFHDLRDEKRAARKYFRSTASFDFLQPTKFINVNEAEINLDFLRCRELGEVNQLSYYNDFILTGRATVKNILESVEIVKPFVNWTVAKLREEIKSKLAAIPEDLRKQYTYKLTTVNKEELRKRFQSLVQLIEDLEMPVEYPREDCDNLLLPH